MIGNAPSALLSQLNARPHTMPRFVALLRGVNVGKNNRVPMAQFKSLLCSLGYTDVSTLLNSGNAVFTSTGRSSSKHASDITAAILQELGVNASTIVKSAPELAAVVENNPIIPPASDHSKFVVVFAADVETLQGLVKFQDLAQLPERFVVEKQAAYLHCPDGLLKCRVGEALLGKAGKSVTTRNWATVLKLQARISERVD